MGMTRTRCVVKPALQDDRTSGGWKESGQDSLAVVKAGKVHISCQKRLWYVGSRQFREIVPASDSQPCPNPRWGVVVPKRLNLIVSMQHLRSYKPPCS